MLTARWRETAGVAAPDHSTETDPKPGGARTVLLLSDLILTF